MPRTQPTATSIESKDTESETKDPNETRLKRVEEKLGRFEEIILMQQQQIEALGEILKRKDQEIESIKDFLAEQSQIFNEEINRLSEKQNRNQEDTYKLKYALPAMHIQLYKLMKAEERRQKKEVANDVRLSGLEKITGELCSALEISPLSDQEISSPEDSLELPSPDDKKTDLSCSAPAAPEMHLLEIDTPSIQESSKNHLAPAKSGNLEFPKEAVAKWTQLVKKSGLKSKTASPPAMGCP